MPIRVPRLVLRYAEKLLKEDSPACSCGWGSNHSVDCDVEECWEAALSLAVDDAGEWLEALAAETKCPVDEKLLDVVDFALVCESGHVWVPLDNERHEGTLCAEHDIYPFLEWVKYGDR